ncbi:MAG: elongation factor Ts [Magnetococcales bacterium]|nr:elongation factor Ts [Magnetococcales bacterium]MBF0172438.1 elongation factor Ts [Magnetococcales bacterium]MBF0347721.1 elongation factor Ts [Magnetococcales bacterium]MBF0631386.1 elongation factor Ts [Magnetococcales bacterium]
MAVSANLVKELREKTGVGMMDCKKALAETGGDLEAAVDWLRKKGLSSAAKKAGRVAAEGKVVAASNATMGVLLEVNSETDFAAKNDKFIAFAQTAAELALTHKIQEIDPLAKHPYPGTGRTVGEELTHQIATIGENMNLRRLASLEVAKGCVATYIHMQGKIGVLVGVEGEGDGEKLADLGRKLAMHVAASAPPYLDRASVSQEDLQRERTILTEQARSSGKPDNIIEKMVEGRLTKFYSENCLLEQPFIMEPDLKVGKMVEQTAKQMNTSIRITGFKRFVLGDGLQKREDDFAEEVAKAAKV